MAYSSQPLRRGALLAGTVAVLGLLTACGSHDARVEPAKTASGTAAPATEASQGSTSGTSATPGTSAGAATPAGTPSSPAGQAPASSGTGSKTGGTTGSRCHSSDLSASVGRNDPGAGQENFPLVLTNKSARTCTVRGYPGAAFVNASGTQLGPDPKRSPGSPVTVTLKPGQSAWAGLTFSNPEISEAETATPAALLITPPDEKGSLKVAWTAGPVPVAGNSSSVFLTVLNAGTGA
ncbi:DUF4232 domain-containing protein [Streptomyces sp. NPDC047085]|uniref:DUF4232 domain-containing protein n=1 Tax=Streptomyces sp. NPDC047085 TaxID=3155140 RepID=UPI0033D3D9CF